MTSTANWTPLEADVKTVFAHEEDSLGALAEARMPGIVLRRAYDPAHCTGLIQRFIEHGLMRDSETSNPELENSFQFARSLSTRIDIDTSLVNRTRGHQAVSDDDALSALAPAKDSRLPLSPMDGSTAPPSFASITPAPLTRPTSSTSLYATSSLTSLFPVLRTNLLDSSTFRILLTQGRVLTPSCTGVLGLRRSSPTISNGTFYEYAVESDIEQYRIEVEPDGFYLFNNRCIHEVAAVEGTIPRIVLAIFIDYSEDDDEIFVWA